MSFEFFIAKRYLKAKRKQAFVSVISLISIAGVAIGVMALIVVIGVMAGFEAELKSKILGVSSHVMVMRYGGNFYDYRNISNQIATFDEVEASTPFIYSQVILRSKSNVSGCILRGIDPLDEKQLTDFKKNLTQGNVEALNVESNDNGDYHAPGIILGKELAKTLSVQLDEMIYVISPQGMLSPIGHMPAMRRFTVVGIVDSGLYEYDASLSYVHIKAAQKILRMDDTVTGIELRLRDPYHDVKSCVEKIGNQIGYPYWTRDWIQNNRNLFSALKLEKVTMFIILTLIVLVAAFNIASTLIMMVMERTRDIAILKAMGVNKWGIRKIFVINGLIIGSVGTFIGVICGIGLCFILKHYHFIELPKDVYYVTTIPVKLQTFDVCLIAISAVVISFFATLYPASQASKLDPVEALRYE